MKWILNTIPLNPVFLLPEVDLSPQTNNLLFLSLILLVSKVHCNDISDLDCSSSLHNDVLFLFLYHRVALESLPQSQTFHFLNHFRLYPKRTDIWLAIETNRNRFFTWILSNQTIVWLITSFNDNSSPLTNFSPLNTTGSPVIRISYWTPSISCKNVSVE